MSSTSSAEEFKRSFDEVSGIFIAALRDGTATPVVKEQPDDDHDGVIYRDKKIEDLCALAENVAKTPSTVLLTGETGVGKEVFARFIHRKSKVAEGPMVAINCAALSESLLESELFGHEKGAFSGAIRRHIGVFEQAHGGTILLDEVSEMPLQLQAKLLRVIQERQVMRVGGSEAIDVDIRIIATTNRDLAQYVEDGHFRRDLYFRINVFPLEIPALRERPRDIEPLAKYYIRRLARTFDTAIKGFTKSALQKLEAYGFPGNIRELINILERALIMAEDSNYIEAKHIYLQKAPNPTEEAVGQATDSAGLGEDTDVDDENAHMVQFRAGDVALTDIRRVVIEQALDRNEGNRSQTAKQLGVSTRTIRNKLKDYDADDKS